MKILENGKRVNICNKIYNYGSLSKEQVKTHDGTYTIKTVVPVYIDDLVVNSNKEIMRWFSSMLCCKCIEYELIDMHPTARNCVYLLIKGDVREPL